MKPPQRSEPPKKPFVALVFNDSRGTEDINELTRIRKDGNRFPAVASVTTLRDAQDTINSAAAPEIEIQSGESEALVQSQLPVGAPPRTVLYVEDNPANMDLVEQIIARCPDIRMMSAVNGTTGIELARATQPTVILMDINLPDISGIKALKILSEDPLTAHIPVVALSANAMLRDIANGLEAGFFRYVTKPIKIKDFMRTLTAALEYAEEPDGQSTMTQDR